MTDITKEEGQALNAVLGLAENSPIWSEPSISDPEMAVWVNKQYHAIGIVREFLKRNGILTLHEITKRLHEQERQKQNG